MPALFTRLENAVLAPLHRPALSGAVEHGAFWSLAAVLLVILARLLPGQNSTFTLVALIVVMPLWFVFSSILIYRWMVRHLLWKVSNRLVVTYLLMGLAPVVLFVTLAFISAYVFFGQFATFAASSEVVDALGRIGAENQAFAVHVAHSVARAPGTRTVELADFEAAKHTSGRLIVDAWEDGDRLDLTNENRSLPQHTVDDPILYPTWSHDGFRGIVMDDGRLFLRAVNVRTISGHAITFVSSAPLDAVTLDRLAQGLGVIQIVPDVGRHFQDDDAMSIRATGNAGKGESSRKAEAQTVGTVSGGTLAPAVVLLDRRITFFAPMPTTAWQNGKQLTSLLSVTSRPALLYAHLFGTAVHVGTYIWYAMVTLAAIFAVLELIAFVMAVRLNRTITRSVAELYDATIAIDGGDFAHRIDVQRQDQLGALSTSFNTMSESLERLLEQQREKERMQSELEIAQEVQNNLFPQGQVQVPGLELHGVCKPARTVSGDYYDFLLMGSNELCLAIGDISGKGISAALLMASLHSAVRAYRFAGEECEDGAEPDAQMAQGAVTFSAPGKVLSMLNRHLFRSTQPEKYATLFLAHYNTQSRRVVYSNGGQLPPFVLCTDGSVRRLDQGGSVVGLLDNLSYAEGAVTLDAGDILIAYSDGVTEPENEFGEFGEERLIETVQRHRHLPLAAISQQVMQALRAWIGEQEQPDDITLVLARQAATAR